MADCWEVVLAGKWMPYGPKEQKLFSEALQRGETTVEYTARGHSYTVDLDSLQQVNPDTGKTRAIRNATMGGDEESDGEDIVEAAEEDVKEAVVEAAEEEEETETVPAVKKRRVHTPPKATMKVSKFLRKSSAHTFKFQAVPKEFSGGHYGWHYYAVSKLTVGDEQLVANVTCLAKVIGSKITAHSKFKKAAPVKNLALEAKPIEFSTGSYGWKMYKKGKMLCEGKMLPVQVTLNAVVRGSKPATKPKAKAKGKAKAKAKRAPKPKTSSRTASRKSSSVDEPVEADAGVAEVGEDTVALSETAETETLAEVEDEETPEAEADDDEPIDEALKAEVFKAVGPAASVEDDLKKVTGVGPWTEKKLAEMGIYSFKQLGALPLGLHERVLDNIGYCPGQDRGTEMLKDARTLSTGRQPVRARSFAVAEEDATVPAELEEVPAEGSGRSLPSDGLADTLVAPP
uniref:WWE domain-containing protein n=1 Tax=Noctiluca scintillans TaxID=2966 RepID=A0A7S1AD25_NOCSC